MKKSKIHYKHLQNPDFARKYDFDVRKHLHVKLFTKTKNELKVMAHRMDMSLQEIFERLAQCIVDEDPYIIRVLNEHKIEKENNTTKSFFSETDMDTLLDTIQRNSPLKDNDD